MSEPVHPQEKGQSIAQSASPTLHAPGRLTIREERTIDHAVDEPIKVLPGNVRDEPSETLSVETDLACDTALDQPVCVDHVAVELEAL